MLVAFIFLFGLVIGSFLNVIIDRTAEGRSIVKGRSECDYCHHILEWYDLIPICSFFFLFGKCRYCKKKLSWQYPLIELLTGVTAIGLFYFVFHSSIYQVVSITKIIAFSYYFFIFSCFIVLFFTDFKYEFLPDNVILVGSIVSFFFILLTTDYLLSNHVLSGFGASLFFLLLYLATKKRGMGFGDVKLAIFLGFFVGFPNIFTGLYVAFLTGGMVGIILVVLRKKKFHGDKIPFGPFLIGGTIISFFWGHQLWQIALRILGL